LKCIPIEELCPYYEKSRSPERMAKADYFTGKSCTAVHKFACTAKVDDISADLGRRLHAHGHMEVLTILN